MNFVIVKVAENKFLFVISWTYQYEFIFTNAF